MTLSPRDDAATHPKTEAIDWRESYYCNFFDLGSDLHGLAWLGVRPNAERGEMLFAIFDGERPLLRAVDFAVPVSPDVADERTTLGPLTFECIEPWRRWRIRYDDGRSRATVDWRPLSDVCDWDWEDVTRSKHYQAAGLVEVDATVDGRRISFSGRGERDRAWGERNYGFWTFVWWLVVQFQDDSAAHVFLMKDEHGRDRLHGYLHTDGVTRSVARYEAEVGYTPNGGPPERARHTIHDEDGRVMRITEMERMHHFSFSADGPQVEDRPPEGLEHGRMFWTFHRFIRDDGAVGRGMIDYVFWSGEQPRKIDVQGPASSTIYDFGRATSVIAD